MPFAGYADFAACVAANQDKKNPEAYCGAIKNAVEKRAQVVELLAKHTSPTHGTGSSQKVHGNWAHPGYWDQYDAGTGALTVTPKPGADPYTQGALFAPDVELAPPPLDGITDIRSRLAALRRYMGSQDAHSRNNYIPSHAQLYREAITAAAPTPSFIAQMEEDLAFYERTGLAPGTGPGTEFYAIQERVVADLRKAMIQRGEGVLSEIRSRIEKRAGVLRAEGVTRQALDALNAERDEVMSYARFESPHRKLFSSESWRGRGLNIQDELRGNRPGKSQRYVEIPAWFVPTWDRIVKSGPEVPNLRIEREDRGRDSGERHRFKFTFSLDGEVIGTVNSHQSFVDWMSAGYSFLPEGRTPRSLAPLIEASEWGARRYESGVDTGERLPRPRVLSERPEDHNSFAFRADKLGPDYEPPPGSKLVPMSEFIHAYRQEKQYWDTRPNSPLARIDEINAQMKEMEGKLRFGSEAREVISEIRPTGGQVRMTSKRAKLYPRFEKSMAVWPTEWIEYSNERTGPIRLLTKDGRGHYQSWDRTITLPETRDIGTHAHEYAHHLEKFLPELRLLSNDFYNYRTAGQPRSTMQKELPGHGYRADEDTIPDDFGHPYMGRDYRHSNWELLSMSVDHMFFKPWEKRDGKWLPPQMDEEMTAWALGVFGFAKPTPLPGDTAP